MVVGNPRGSGDLSSFVADGYNFIDRDGLGKRPARRIIPSERGATAGLLNFWRFGFRPCLAAIV